jgi:hypothetical protein
MREVTKQNYNILSWRQIIKMIQNISYGLENIHNKNYHHKDFHSSGNILNNIKRDISFNENYHQSVYDAISDH